MNTVCIIGRLAQDPEIRTTNNGVSVTSFTVAVDRDYKHDDGTRDTDFIDVVAWRQTAEFICKYFNKGKSIAVTGTLQTRNYEDRNGNKRKAVEVVAESVDFCGDKKQEREEEPPQVLNDDELPF